MSRSTILARRQSNEALIAHGEEKAVRPSTNTYSERLRVPLRWWLTWLLFVGTFWIAMVVALPAVWTWGFTAGLVVVVVAALGWYGDARIRVAEGWLEAGRARIELRFLADVEVLDPSRMREIAGPGANARAYLLLRPYLRGGVRVTLCDPADPTPYWLLSSRRPQRLAAALRSAMTTTVGAGSP
jgi:hypothetical protein